MAIKKKVLLCITKSNLGGAQRYVHDLASSLPKDQFDVIVAAGGDGWLLQACTQEGIRTVTIPSMGRDVALRGDMRAFWGLVRIFRQEKPDIVHLSSSKAGALGALAARLCGVRRVIFTVHGWPFNEPVPRLTKAFRWTASLATLLLCHRTITVSHFESVHAPLLLPTIMIHNGLPEIPFLPCDEARQRVPGLGGDVSQPVIGVIAELHKNKGIDLLVQAMSGVEGARLIVIGSGEEQAALERQIEESGLSGRVRLAGFIPDAASLMKAFDIFVLPSRTEALGYVLLEAGLAGVPVVATTVGGIPEVIDDQISGVLVPAYDSDALAEALDTLIKNPRTRARYAERLKEKVLRYFPLSGMIKKTVEVYGS